MIRGRTAGSGREGGVYGRGMERSESTARDGAAAERLLWHVETSTGVHLVDILPSAFGGSVAVELDGRKVAGLAKPTDARTSSMATFDLDGSSLAVLLTVAHPVMHVEVFRDGVSLADGRTMEAARRSVPAPVPRFERWTDTNLTGVSSAAIAPAWLWATTAVAILVVIAGVAAARSVVVAMIGGWVLIGIFVRGWLIVTARAHRYLRGRADLGDWTRLALLSGAFLAVPIASAVILVGALLALT